MDRDTLVSNETNEQESEKLQNDQLFFIILSIGEKTFIDIRLVVAPEVSLYRGETDPNRYQYSYMGASLITKE